MASFDDEIMEAIKNLHLNAVRESGERDYDRYVAMAKRSSIPAKLSELFHGLVYDSLHLRKTGNSSEVVRIFFNITLTEAEAQYFLNYVAVMSAIKQSVQKIEDLKSSRSAESNKSHIESLQKTLLEVIGNDSVWSQTFSKPEEIQKQAEDYFVKANNK